MKEIHLSIPDGYDPASQPLVAIFAAQLDDQIDRLQKAVDGLTVEQLEWQMRPGMNTIGMLLAHIAINLAFWVKIAPEEIPIDPDAYNRVEALLGIRGDDDGIPLDKQGTHPRTLSGVSLTDYIRMLDIARREMHAEMQTWTDDRLDTCFVIEDHRISHAWALYHALEHLAVHLGQIHLLKHIMRDEGILAAS